MTTRIDLLERISFEDLKSRWHWAGNLPPGLALEMVTEGRLRVQVFGRLIDRSKTPDDLEMSIRDRNGEPNDAKWYTLRTDRARNILTHDLAEIACELQIGGPASNLLDIGALHARQHAYWFELKLFGSHLFDRDFFTGANLGIMTCDVLALEAEFGVTSAPPTSRGPEPTPGQANAAETRGNNFSVQFNILEAAIITLVEAIEDGSAAKFLHKPGRHTGLNAAKLAAEIDDNRHRFHLLQLKETGLDAPRGAARERIQKLLRKVLQQDLSRSVCKGSANKKLDRST